MDNHILICRITCLNKTMCSNPCGEKLAAVALRSKLTWSNFSVGVTGIGDEIISNLNRSANIRNGCVGVWAVKTEVTLWYRYTLVSCFSPTVAVKTKASVLT